MRLDKFTVKAQEAIFEAQNLAGQYGNQQIEPEHLFQALLDQPEGLTKPILQKLGADPAAIRADLVAEIQKLPKVSGATGDFLSPAFKRVLDLAQVEASKLKDEYTSTEHLLLALAEVKESRASRLLRDRKITRDALLKALVDIRGAHRVTDQNPEAKYQALKRYSRDLTDLARR